MVIPAISNYKAIEAETPEEAANEYHYNYSDGSLKYIKEEQDGKHVHVLFARIEVENEGTWISKVYSHGIFRRGRKYNNPSLIYLAEQLGYADDPKTLIDDWESEESIEEAEEKWRERFRNDKL
jgi:hypothetical protein